MNRIERKLSKNRGSYTITLNSDLLKLLGYKDKVFIEITETQEIILRKEDIKNEQSNL